VIVGLFEVDPVTVALIVGVADDDSVAVDVAVALGGTVYVGSAV